MRWVWGDGVSTGWVYGSVKQRGDEGGAREKKKNEKEKKKKGEKPERERKKEKEKIFF